MPLAFLAFADKRGLRVLGLEGFRLEGATVIPDIDAILDLSSLHSRSRSITEAIDFVQPADRAKMLFDFAFDEPPNDG